jgi:hypothetical protein
MMSEWLNVSDERREDRDPSVRTRRVMLALATGLALTALAVAVTLLHAPATVAFKNGTYTKEEVLGSVRGKIAFCQANEQLPRQTTALRFWLGALNGPSVSAHVLSGERAITSGQQGSGWTGRVVTVPVKPLQQTVTNVTVCLAFQARDETVTLYGRATPSSAAAFAGQQPLPGRIWIEYLRPGKSSWASMASSIVDHMELGRAASGIWIVLLALGLLATIVVLGSSLVLRELR